MSLEIRPLTTADSEIFHAIRYHALADTPTAYFTTLEEAKHSEQDYFRDWLDANAVDNVMYGLFEAETLIGITGLSREPRAKRRHIAWIRSVFVKPAYRGKRLGRRLVAHAIEQARSMDGVDLLQLSVESGNVVARSCYESLGFVTWGREFPAAKADGLEYGEDYMMLRI